jgi:GntR family transcriptional regulator/MocR family aminotransferase
MDPLLGLPIALPRRGSGALTVALHGQLRAAILDGRLQSGVRLPSTRALAAACGISRNTVLAVYELLLSEGYVVTRRGSGTVVARALPGRAGGPRRASGPGVERRLSRYWRARTPTNAGASATATAAAPCSFQIGVPDSVRFPHDVWRRLRGRVERQLRRTHAAMPNAQGLPALRDAIARHVSFARAVACSPADIVVTSGAQQAFDLLARVLVTPGRTVVAIEEPGYPPQRAAFAAQGARLAAVPVDADGLVVERLPAAARVICVAPSHQFPLGAVMAGPRRTSLLEFCARHDAVVIEDDYDCEFRYASRPLDALQTLDREQRVLYVGTFSKSLSPDLRLGYIVAPQWAVASLIAARELADGHGSAVLQATTALLISEGHLARHVRRMQRLYERRRAVLLQGLRSDLSHWLEPLPSAAGLHVTARFVVPRQERAVVARAREAGVAVGALGRYFMAAPSIAGLTFGFGDIEESRILEGIERLRASLRARPGR